MGLASIFTSPIIDLISKVIDRAIPDPTEKAKLQLELAKLDQELMKGQIDVNKQEAAHASVFVAGWRPAIGWIGAVGLGYSFIIEPMSSWAARVIFNYAGTFPALSTGDLMWLVAGMLGFGTVRAFEKVKGVAREESPIGTPEKSNPPTNPPKKKKGLDIWPW